ncbi:MAG: LysR family transcriptional regulator [Hyphomicrobiales bacterium]
MHTLRHLKLVRALANHRHFGKAAESLGVSQPALTRSLRNLEESLGVRLFDRDGQVEPTVYGRIILERSGAIVTGFADLRRELDLVRNLDVGTLTIGAGPYPAEISVHRAMGRLSQRYPHLHLTAAVKDWLDVVQDVRAGRTDVGIGDISGVTDDPDLDIEPVRQSPLRFFGRKGHPLTERKPLTLSDLCEYPWAGPRLPSAMRAFVEADRRPFAIYDPETGLVSPRLRLETLQAIRQVVESSDTISAAPDVLLADPAMTAAFALLPVEAPWLKLNYGFLWRRGRTLSPAAVAFMAEVRAVEAEATARLSSGGATG